MKSGLSSVEKENLIELSCDFLFKRKFRGVSLIRFKLDVKGDNNILSKNIESINAIGNILRIRNRIFNLSCNEIQTSCSLSNRKKKIPVALLQKTTNLVRVQKDRDKDASTFGI